MEVERPAFLPDPALSHEEMADLQREIAATARFADDVDFDPAAIAVDDPIPEPDEGGSLEDAQRTLGDEQQTPGDAQQTPGDARTSGGGRDSDAPVVVGVDQAFLDDASVSAVVAVQDGVVVERVCGHAPLEIPYVPGLLAFREGGAIVDGLERLSVEPDLLVLDGNGRIHFRQAGIATHVGVLFDAPAVGVAKNLLCGEPAEPVDDPLPEGTAIPIEAGDEMTAPDGTTIGHVYQSRQFPNPETRHVNPIYVSSGHRVGDDTAVDLVEALCAGYKLPEPTRLADSHAEVCKREAPDGTGGAKGED